MSTRMFELRDFGQRKRAVTLARGNVNDLITIYDSIKVKTRIRSGSNKNNTTRRVYDNLNERLNEYRVKKTNGKTGTETRVGRNRGVVPTI